MPIGGSSAQHHYPSEGTTIKLKDGSILHAFNYRKRPRAGESLHPHYVETAIAAVTSKDGGLTWTAPRPLLQSDAKTASHPSIVRLPNGALGITYNKIESSTRAYKVFRSSDDEGRTWSDEEPISPRDSYWTSAHDRMIVHSSGRILHPLHKKLQLHPERMATQLAWSDDNGKTWSMGKQMLDVAAAQAEYARRFPGHSGFWEVSLAERADGSLLMLGRTAAGFLYFSTSSDRGASWSAPAPTTLQSGLAPVRIARIPSSNDLLAIWNSCCIDPTESHLGNRLTLATAVSSDGGATWKGKREIESIQALPEARFTDVSYPSIYFDGSTAYVMYFVRRLPGDIEGEQYVSVLPVSWFYAETRKP